MSWPNAADQKIPSNRKLRFIARRFGEHLEGLFGGSLLGVFFVLPYAFAIRDIADDDLDRECTVMIRAVLADRHIARRTKSLRLRALEELALEIFIFDTHDPLLKRRADMPLDEPLRGEKASVEVDGADDRFERVGEDRIHPFALHLGGARAHENKIPQLHVARVDAEGLPVDEPRANLCQIPFMGVRTGLKEEFRDNEIEHCVPQEFKAFVRKDGFIVGDLEIRAVCERFGKQRLAADAILQRLLKFREINAGGGTFPMVLAGTSSEERKKTIQDVYVLRSRYIS